MNEEIGTMAGAIWRALEASGQMTAAKLKKEVKGAAPVFDWAIGWLAREGKIELAREKQSVRVCLTGWRAKEENAA